MRLLPYTIIGSIGHNLLLKVLPFLFFVNLLFFVLDTSLRDHCLYVGLFFLTFYKNTGKVGMAFANNVPNLTERVQTLKNDSLTVVPGDSWTFSSLQNMFFAHIYIFHGSSPQCIFFLLILFHNVNIIIETVRRRRFVRDGSGNRFQTGG